MTGEKVLFAVAVGRAERLEHLPGAWTAAWAMADCATAAGYRPYLVDDAGGEAVTIQRLRDTFQPVLEAPELIEHLIFYFAGHGFSRGTGDQILLLSGWRRDTNETIAVRLLHRRLSQYSVRRFTQIIDACSSLPGVETDDVGGADLFRTGDDRDNVAAQDVFQAAVHGRLAYMLRGDAQTAPVCLYSAVVMQALAGADAAADGAGRDVVRSQDIARHLTTNFKVMADRYGVTQRPTWTSGFLAPDDVYAKLPVAFRPPVLPEPKAAIAQSARDLAAEMPSEREIHSVEAGASIETTSGTTDVLARSQVSRLGSALAVAIALIQVVFAAAITVFAALIIINAYEIIAAYEPLHELFSRLHQLADERDLFQIVKMGLGAAAVIIAVWFMPGSLSS